MGKERRLLMLQRRKECREERETERETERERDRERDRERERERERDPHICGSSQRIPLEAKVIYHCSLLRQVI